MKYFASPAFSDSYAKLPAAVRAVAEKNFALLKDDPRRPSLQLKRVGGYWSVRAGLRYRALAAEVQDGFVSFWIGSHADYGGLIG